MLVQTWIMQRNIFNTHRRLLIFITKLLVRRRSNFKIPTPYFLFSYTKPTHEYQNKSLQFETKTTFHPRTQKQPVCYPQKKNEKMKKKIIIARFSRYPRESTPAAILSFTKRKSRNYAVYTRGELLFSQPSIHFFSLSKNERAKKRTLLLPSFPHITGPWCAKACAAAATEGARIDLRARRSRPTRM